MDNNTIYKRLWIFSSKKFHFMLFDLNTEQMKMDNLDIIRMYGNSITSFRAYKYQYDAWYYENTCTYQKKKVIWTYSVDVPMMHYKIFKHYSRANER